MPNANEVFIRILLKYKSSYDRAPWFSIRRPISQFVWG